MEIEKKQDISYNKDTKDTSNEKERINKEKDKIDTAKKIIKIDSILGENGLSNVDLTFLKKDSLLVSKIDELINDDKYKKDIIELFKTKELQNMIQNQDCDGINRKINEFCEKNDKDLLSQKQKAYKDIFDKFKIDSYTQERIKGFLESLSKGDNINFSLIENFDDYSEEEISNIQKAIDTISIEILGQKPWTLPSIKDMQNEISKADKIEIITHPLYGLLRGKQWDKKAWKESGENVEIYLTNEILKVVKEVNIQLKKYPNNIPMAYLYLMEISQEILAMQQPPEKGTIRIYNMPRKSLLTNEQQTAMQQLLDIYKTKNTVVMDTYYDSTGRLTLDNVNFFNKYIKKDTLVELQGGYLGGCLDSTYYSFKK